MHLWNPIAICDTVPVKLFRAVTADIFLEHILFQFFCLPILSLVRFPCPVSSIHFNNYENRGGLKPLGIQRPAVHSVFPGSVWTWAIYENCCRLN